MQSAETITDQNCLFRGFYGLISNPGANQDRYVVFGNKGILSGNTDNDLQTLAAVAESYDTVLDEVSWLKQWVGQSANSLHAKILNIFFLQFLKRNFIATEMCCGWDIWQVIQISVILTGASYLVIH